MEQQTRDRITVKGALSALALGAGFGGVWSLCGQGPDGAWLLCAVLQSMVSGIVLGIGSSARPQDLALDLESLDKCLESSHRSARGTLDICRLEQSTRPTFVVA
jgi:hypothetical protein